MQRVDDEGPVYYREIQKNGYLKRIPCDVGGKLKPLNNKKPPLKPMWTLFCVHNGRTPYLEQYPEPGGGAALSHRPVWRACLSRARHVTASLKPYVAREHDFLIDTEVGAVRMLAPDWATMQDWVSSLRKALLELKIVAPHENVYCGPAAPLAARAAARDPTSPLPPTPLQPPDRVPGIELTVPSTRQTTATITNEENEVQETTHDTQITNNESTEITLENNSNQSQNNPDANVLNEEENINRNINFINHRDVINTENTIDNQVKPINQRNSITNPEEFNNIPDNIENVDISEWESSSDLSLPSTSQVEKKSENFAKTKSSVAKICGQNICLDDSIFKRTTDRSDEDFLQEIESFNATIDNLELSSVGMEEGGFTQRVTVNSDGENSSSSQSSSENSEPNATNITVINVNKAPPHTAIPILGKEQNVFNFDLKQDLTIKQQQEKNYINIVHTESNAENGYGTIFSTKQSDYGHISLTTTVNVTGSPTPSINRTRAGINRNDAAVNRSDAPINQTDAAVNRIDAVVNMTDAIVNQTDDGIYERLCMASTSKEMGKIKKIKQEAARKSSLPNLEVRDGNATYEYIFPGNTGANGVVGNDVSVGNTSSVQLGAVVQEASANTRSVPISPRPQPTTIQPIPSPRSLSNYPNTTQQTNSVDPNAVAIRCNVERSNSHNTYDNLRRFHSPRRDKDKPDQPAQNKTIWKRALTEITLLSKLRARTAKRSHNVDTVHRTESTKVVHRARAEARIDNNRRRSSSLSEEPRPPCPAAAPPRVREARRLAAEQARGSAVQGSLPRDAAVAQYSGHLWIASWGGSGAAAVRCNGRSGDRIAAVMGVRTRDAAHAASIALQHPHSPLKILFHRVPLAKIFVLNKNTDNEALGIKLDSECNITCVVANSPAGRALVPAAGWAVTEVNNRPVNLLKGGEEDMNRLGRCGKEISLLIQPSALVKKIRSALKSNKTITSYR